MLHRYFHADKPMRLEHVCGVLWVGMQHVNDGIAGELRAAGFTDVRVIGDAIAPRRLLQAIGEGHKAGRAI